ncbi:hypothetical protein AB0A69_27930 [Streptomyces sp. NPDC045431]|uniref:hypothetical protein n=1 Tax=Streptomyces sp. NPDC045431 TaxID=3155613 RepID=UPI0033FC26B5
MNVRYVGAVRRVGIAALLATCLVFSVTACGDGEGAKAKEDSSKESSAPAASTGAPASDGKTLPDTSKVLATLKGERDIEMIIHEARRDDGGFVTVSGQLKNTGSSLYTTPVQWSGQETEVARTGRSMAAMTLVDSKEKKRHYVLRDTDNRPLTTSGYKPSIAAGESLAFFAQFPAPPQATTSVDLQFPGFPNAPIEIS